MHASVSPASTGFGAIGWSWDPGVVIPIVASVALYVLGARAIRRRDVERGCAHGGVPTWRSSAFVAGIVVLVIALVSPLDRVSDQLFSVHMIQHELLMAVAAPLLVLGDPLLVMLWAFPAGARQSIGRTLRGPVVRRTWHVASRPFDAWLIHLVAIWGWHVPFLFQAALRSDAVHALQHASFLGSGLLFWWAVIHPRRRAMLGMSIIYLFTTAVHTAVLGALMTMSRTPWYPLYGSAGAAWGLTPLADQQLAGLVMWIPASLTYLVAALLILRRWIRESEWSVVRAEGSAAAA
jgi:cytochrome c oxidase assembly factor CtaG